ncbi:P22 phage major capsid protein family protein [Nocardia ignorata]|uniref:P22 coat protein Gp5 n=1 Tax=Nocardia ignorata TaxID=145285 RepID=A0A4R6NZN6_NOCIG|nr:P22 phage major capsid protein family protein [Nocardia ignorata]TDP29767.1 P22 coat protein Gp5 [Nocardia ignorata]
MANTFLTPDVIARQVLANLYENLVMLPLVHTGYSGEFQAKVGDTVNVRKPAVLNAALFDRTAGIQVQNATETSVPVKLDKIADISLEITDESALLELESMDAQIAVPAAEGLAQFVDRAIIAHMKANTTAFAGVTPAGHEWDKPEVLIEAGRQLDIQKVPSMRRHAVVGPTAKAKWLNSDLLKRYDQSGSTEALRRGSIGDNLFNFDAYMTQNIVQPSGSPASGQPTTEVGLAFHETAFTFTSVPLPRPLSAGTSYAIETYKGISLRTTIDRDHVHKQDIISFDILYGVATLDANRSVLLRGPLQA